ncbi:LysR family transcriptional regulator [Enterobacter hormaechei]|uniref:LysR family transcriptional regulator n=1 Tax=Enterobacter cloacae complex TaxID=354276 RepID=UPI00064AE2DC|nr:MULTISPECIES: LysR family transcriptional regulator [Enterobacter cloacae complex]MBT1829444.1 LysR family transcriptional regulator [Enterobacter hormaechei subsp. xiangfangensis]ELC6389940.1 LysR family transcriptional regulator [Enterobacter hormaechei]ELJ5764986.1 LysR family transcriptional regulator [Enterobacter hormaechei]ELT6634001.1 LysR family transcriptional regulator [Enterobacter hormaechei]KLP81473.1 LysR family transcriptional regulator [Enterobacter hormaechei subsp. steige
MENGVASLIYSFAQLEAFTAVAEHGSLMKAASKLGKDRTTLRDLIDFLEDGLGYALFLREGRSLRLTPEGEQLQRQAHLLMRQVKAFEAFARSVPDSATQDIALAYDPFTPRAFLQALIATLAAKKIRLSLTSASRDEAEARLANGQADLGICQARNRSVGNEMEWRALGAIEMDFYAATALFAEVASPVSLLALSLVPQVIMHAASDEPVARRLQISGHTLFANELEMLRGLLEQGCGWGFLPTHLQATQWKNVKRLPTEVGSQGISQTMVTIWKPGSDKRGLINDTLSLLPALWKRSAL